MKKLVLFSTLLVMTVLSGCFNRTQLVSLDITPADATVIINGAVYEGISPFVVDVERNRQLAITVYKPGYKDKLHIVDYSLSSLGKAEAWTSFLILPAIGLCYGSAWELNENNIKITLEPTENIRKMYETK